MKKAQELENMKSNDFYKIVFLFVLMPTYAISGNGLSFPQFTNQEDNRRFVLESLRESYSYFSKKEANRQNILGSIDTGIEAFEVASALAIAERDSAIFAKIPFHLLLIINKNYADEQIKLKSARLVLRTNRALGIEKLKEILKGDQISWQAKLGAADALVDYGDLSGYLATKEYFLGKSKIEALEAAFILEKFLRFEGVAFSGEESCRIDVRKSVSKAAPEVQKEFEKWEKRSNRVKFIKSANEQKPKIDSSSGNRN